MSHADPIELEAYVAGEPPSATLLAHLDSCADCAAQLQLAARLESALFDAAEASSECVACARVVSGDRCVGCGVAAHVRGYVVERVLASGPVGRVYAGRAANGERVAVKELSFAGGPSAEALAAFEREATVLARLDHPSIPRFVESFSEGQGTDTRAYLVQELIDGEPLAALVHRHQFSEREIIDVLGQVLDALVYLQSLTPMVFHRDVKPANLIRRTDGRIALVDFGAARDLGATAGATVVGTFGYMQLEQLAGIVDATTDLHALGATAWHLATRIEPWRLWSDPSLQKRSNLSPQLSRFLARLVAREPHRRFTDAVVARDAWRSVHAARRDGRAQRPWRALAALSVAASLSTVAAVAVHEHKARILWWHHLPIGIVSPNVAETAPPLPNLVPPVPPNPPLVALPGWVSPMDGIGYVPPVPPNPPLVALPGWESPMDGIGYLGIYGIVEPHDEIVKASDAEIITRVHPKQGDEINRGAPLVAVKGGSWTGFERAPIDGVVTQLLVKEGAPIEKGQAIARIVDHSENDAVVEVAEYKARQLKIGSRGVARANGFVGEGVVRRIGSEAHDGSVVVLVRVIGDLSRLEKGTALFVTFPSRLAIVVGVSHHDYGKHRECGRR